MPILLLLALVVLVVGVTFTALTYMNSSDDNTVTTGRISMNYTEPSNALTLENALPMSDTEGINQTKFFEFTVTSNATTNANDDVGVTIPYEINISDIAIDTDKTILPKDKIKVAVTKVVDTKEENVMTPIVISEMTTSVLREAASKVYEAKDVYKNNSNSITTRYRLRAWIDKDFELDNTLTYQYKFRVNVNSQVGVLEVPSYKLSELVFGNNNSNVLTNGDNGLFVTNDTNDGNPSYYYKGAVTNNYVSLPEKNGGTTTRALYRIVRINEDGSIKLIRQNGTSSGYYPFNKDNSTNYKYMYYSNSNVANGVMKSVNDWYASTIKGTKLDEKIIKTNFCEQAKVKDFSDSTSGNATMEAKKDYIPNLKCEEDGNGKGLLNMKVGLLTVDEVLMAGFLYCYNKKPSVYLHNGKHWWTMSPSGFSTGAYAWKVDFSGCVQTSGVASSAAYNVRPVFSLASDVLVKGKGTESEPYEIVFDNN